MSTVINGTTGITAPGASVATGVGGTPAFSAYQSVLQSVASGVATKVQFQSEDFDLTNAFDSTTNYRFQPTVAGYYQIEGACAMFGITTNVNAVGLYKNGVAHKWGSSGSTRLGISALVYLNGSTDYVELYASQGSGSAQNTSPAASDTYLQGYLARAA